MASWLFVATLVATGICVHSSGGTNWSQIAVYRNLGTNGGGNGYSRAHVDSVPRVASCSSLLCCRYCYSSSGTTPNVGVSEIRGTLSGSPMFGNPHVVGEPMPSGANCSQSPACPGPRTRRHGWTSSLQSSRFHRVGASLPSESSKSSRSPSSLL